MSLTCHAVGCRRNRRILFTDVDFALGPGDALRVAGANGSGKTTLLRVLAGLSRPDRGSVSWHGRDVRSHDGGYRSQLLYVGHAPGVDELLTPCENLVFLDLLDGVDGRAAARAALDRAGLAAQADVPVRLLSQGQRRRVALARIHLPQRRQVWVMDEPFNGLDAAATAVLQAAIVDHRAAGGIVIYTTHVDAGPADARRLQLGAAQ